ncbi:ABC transporter permease [Saccharopolyspora sp. HNM0983]|uniref:ABC transporter permease n=1 Tax=Saccharopolyspora montiporae TaxID=2781240 RepID=A0A929BDL5_9PSEU|nr:ABC transporter permease [Saccharopolyspora sp. HNM0983]MBE9375663.1 ABC transporter permease [Saccharopolyspora sp. HNM0983]
MTRLLVKRILLGLVILWAVSVVVFLATQALPGDAARAILGKEATPERLAALRDQLHLDDPIWVQYFSWLGNMFQLDLGESYASGMPVTELLGSRLNNSVALMLCATAISVPLSIIVGTYSALRRDTAFDHTTSVLSLVLASLPEFVVGIVLVLIFSTGMLNLLPAVFVMTGSDSAWSDPVQLILPTATMVLAVSPYIVRIMRATMIEVLESEYVQQARLKGLPERTVIARHALPNAIGPVAQVIALQLAWLAGGVVLVEFLFRFPGIGFALVDAVNNRDLPVVQTLTLAIAAVYIVVNLLADIVSLATNPKVRSAAR